MQMPRKISPRQLLLLLVIVAVGTGLLRPDRAEDLHTRLQQRLIEAELGRATAFYLAAGLRMAEPPSSAPLSQVLGELRSNVAQKRWAAADELAVRRNPAAVNFVIDAMMDPAGTVRVCLMATTLGYLRDPRALGPLTEAAFDPRNRDLRLCAIEALGMLGDPRAVPSLIEALKTRNMPVAAANSIARMGDERGVMPIIEVAADPDISLWMISALGELGSRKALPYLSSRMLDKDATLRAAAAEAQWKIGQVAVEDPVAELARTLAGDADVSHRQWAAFRLGERGDTAAIPSLLAALGDDAADVAERAAAALVRMGAPARIPVSQLARQGNTGQDYAVAILGYLGGAEDILLLERLAREQHQPLATDARRSVELIRRFTAAAAPRRTRVAGGNIAPNPTAQDSSD